MRKALTAFAASAAGLVGGHWLAYALLATESGHRHEWLAATGHGWLESGTGIALVCAVAGLVAAWVKGSRGSGVEYPLGLVVGVQLAGFGLVEFGERALAGAGFADLLPVLLCGFAAQILAATVLRRILGFVAVIARAFGKAAAFGTAESARGFFATPALLREGIVPTPRATRGPPRFS